MAFAFSEKGKLRSWDQVVYQKYRLCLIRTPRLRVCGAGHTHAQIYEWPAASVRRVRGFFTPASRLGTGLELASASGLPDLRLHFSAERRVPNLPPTPWPPHVAGRGRESRELPFCPRTGRAPVSALPLAVWGTWF